MNSILDIDTLTAYLMISGVLSISVIKYDIAT